MKEQKTLKQLRDYQKDWLSHDLKRELREQQKGIETYLDRTKAETRVNYTEQRWN